jgi:hypothetical protein
VPLRELTIESGALRGKIYDCGTRDEWYLDLTLAWVQRRPPSVGVADLHVELLDGTHAAIEHRYPIGIRYLVERLSR